MDQFDNCYKKEGTICYRNLLYDTATVHDFQNIINGMKIDSSNMKKLLI